MIDFSLTEEQQRYRDSVIEFAGSLNEGTEPRDSDPERFLTAWRACADFGIQGLPLPTEFGGSGADAISLALALEAFGYGCRDNGLIFSLNAQMWSCELPILRFGSDEQKRRYLPGLSDGSAIGVQAMTEPESGSDAFGLQCSATEGDGSFVLNGVKTFITNAPVASVFVVFARTDPGRGFAGISAFLVDREVAGLEVGPPLEKMGLRSSPMSELRFDECTVPTSAMLGKRGGGMAIFNHSMDWERGFIFAAAVGSMQRLLERSVEYAGDRTQFDQPIGKYQAVSHRIADMKVRIEASRALLYRFAWLTEQGRATPLESAVVKLHISEAYLQTSLDTLQIHGGYGYMSDSGIEAEVRDAIGGRIYSGTSEMQRNIIAGHLGL